MDKGVSRTTSPLDFLDEVTPAEMAAAVLARLASRMPLDYRARTGQGIHAS
jgi:hypothetical protein